MLPLVGYPSNIVARLAPVPNVVVFGVARVSVTEKQAGGGYRDGQGNPRKSYELWSQWLKYTRTK
jgi:hypothetical protein